ncbi:MAG: helix-turn-helix transcriptional regulator, partial [Acidobacteria bacterium]|nr:helix-turn-helix transcriptional regulator [Acidobacteriota bacterium]
MSDFQITWILHGNTAIAFVDENPFGYTLTSTPDDRAMIVVGDADPGTMDLTRFERETEWIGNDGLTNVERDALADKYTRTAATMSSSDIDAAKARMEARADSLVSAHADLITGLIAMREAKQITRETVAERMGVHPRTVDVFERYDSNPK